MLRQKIKPVQVGLLCLMASLFTMQIAFCSPAKHTPELLGAYTFIESDAMNSDSFEENKYMPWSAEEGLASSLAD